MLIKHGKPEHSNQYSFFLFAYIPGAGFRYIIIGGVQYFVRLSVLTTNYGWSLGKPWFTNYVLSRCCSLGFLHTRRKHGKKKHSLPSLFLGWRQTRKGLQGYRITGLLVFLGQELTFVRTPSFWLHLSARFLQEFKRFLVWRESYHYWDFKSLST